VRVGLGLAVALALRTVGVASVALGNLAAAGCAATRRRRA
jgi:hypothetical protein